MSLFSLIVPVGLYNRKLPIHQIRALVGELSRGRETIENIVAYCNLNEEETTGLIEFVTKLNAHPNPSYLSQVAFDLLSLAENGIEKYQNEDYFYQCIDAEIAKVNGNS